MQKSFLLVPVSTGSSFVHLSIGSFKTQDVCFAI